MSGPHPAVARLRSAVRRDLDALLSPNAASGAGGATASVDAEPDGGPAPLVLVACSGGPDSLALAAAVAFVAPRRGVTAGAVVVDHGLQAESARTAARAAEQCRALGLEPVEVVRVQVGTDGGPEAAARTARYAALVDAARRHGAAAVLLGHTLDDQAETVLLALARGSGSRSLAGMAAVRGLLRRPLLGTPRAVVQQACEAAGLEPWVDPTNLAGANRRAAVRNRVLPVLAEVLGPGVPEALARTADQLRRDEELLAQLAAELLDTARAAAAGVEEGGAEEGGPPDAASPDASSLDAATLAAAPAALRHRALRSALLDWGSPGGSLAAAHVLAVDALVTDWSGQGPVHVPGVTVARRCGRLSPEISR
ncbi:tRNA lysidine(34) synthetase TilS [Actinotalea sp.]|uniref:tRNA lysidine(34) synthetase TilS n=1 Tax=Actinotalea sp. TaxID=1872145 RepID=UPI00356299B7